MKQKSRAYSCPSLHEDTKGFRAKIKRAIFARPNTPCEAFFEKDLTEPLLQRFPTYPGLNRNQVNVVREILVAGTTV